MSPEEPILLLRNLARRENITSLEQEALGEGVDALEKTVTRKE